MKGKGWFGRWVDEKVSEEGLVWIWDEWFGEMRLVEWSKWLKKGGD